MWRMATGLDNTALKHKHEFVFCFSNTDKSNLSDDREVWKEFSAFAAIFFRLG
jgi:hypothetical protein